MTTFASFGLCPPLLRAIEGLKYLEPTAIQCDAIPAIVAGRDVWASAETGSGKTAAFGLAMLERLHAQAAPRTGNVRALVLEPTRELATQVGLALTAYGEYFESRPKVCVAVGGVSINPQMLALRGGADVLVATPGRLLDLATNNAVRLSSVEMLVLDEADRLLSLGFAQELNEILAAVANAQRMLFSATFPPAVRTLAEEVLRDPLRIVAERALELGAEHALITQRAICVDMAKRTLLLRHLLKTHEWPQTLVFVASAYAANHVCDKLKRAKIEAAALHGDLSQGARTESLAAFKSGRAKVLVATDLAGRGLDIEGLSAVVNYDLPRSPVDYVHRIGRTGRAGKPGVAISFVTADSEPHFGLIEKRHHLDLGREVLEGFEPTDMAIAVRDPHGGVKGKRKSKKDKLREAAAQRKS